MRHRAFVFTAVMFFLFAVAFSVVLFPGVSLAAKLAFFATGIGCGVSIAHAARRSS